MRLASIWERIWLVQNAFGSCRADHAASCRCRISYVAMTGSGSSARAGAMPSTQSSSSAIKAAAKTTALGLRSCGGDIAMNLGLSLPAVRTETIDLENLPLDGKRKLLRDRCDFTVDR